MGLLGNRDFDCPVVVAGWMLDVDPSAALVLRIEVQTGEFGTEGTVASPASQTFTFVVQIAIFVQIACEPDIINFATRLIFDDVDVAIVVDRQVVWTCQLVAN